MENVYHKKTEKKVKTNIELAKFEKSSSINLKYLKADNSFQYFAKKKHLTECF